MKKSLTIEDLKSRIRKPIFVVCLLYNCKEWRILKNIGFGGTNTLEFTDDGVIEEELQDKFRFFDEEVTETELKEILEEEEKSKKKTGYETVGKGEGYFFIASHMKAVKELAYDCNNSNDVNLETCANHFNDETLTINLARAERLKYQLRRFAALNGGIPSQQDWENRESKKYYIDYLYHTKVMMLLDTYMHKGFGQIYFKSEKSCGKALEIFKDELLWYFTEFKEMLY